MRKRKNFAHLFKGRSQKNKLNIVLIHDPKKEAKRLIIPWWVISSFLVFVLAFALFTAFSTYNYLNLRTKVAELQEFEKTKEQHEAQLMLLQDKALEVEEKLAAVEALDKEVRTIVGLQPSLTEEKEKRKNFEFSSRSGQNSTDLVRTMKNDFNEIDAVLEFKSLQLQDLKVEVQEKIDEDKAIPDQWPLQGRITDKFGPRNSPFNGKSVESHSGLDIAAPTGTEIRAAGSGQVVFAGQKPIWGNLVVIDHGNGYRTMYAHNSELVVEVGSKVEKGELISKVGNTGRSTGPHLHFGVEKNGQFVDPLLYLKEE